jgi:hypothetical protein
MYVVTVIVVVKGEIQPANEKRVASTKFKRQIYLLFRQGGTQAVFNDTTFFYITIIYIE